MRAQWILAVVLAGLSAQLAEAEPQIRFCPAAQVRSYPEESRRNVNGLLLQNLLISNGDSKPLEVKLITIELLKAGEVVDQRHIDGTALDHAIRSGEALQAGGMIAALPFQFCGRDLVADGVKLAGPGLAPNQALLLAQQVFAFNGARDTLRVRVDGVAGENAASITAELPIRSDFSKMAYRFPLHGVWYVGNGPTFYTDHRWALPEEFAFDLVKLGAGGLTHGAKATRFVDYYDYGA
jgi:hypothetical protein